MEDGDGGHRPPLQSGEERSDEVTNQLSARAGNIRCLTRARQEGAISGAVGLRGDVRCGVTQSRARVVQGPPTATLENLSRRPDRAPSGAMVHVRQRARGDGVRQ